jgi:hypothetical protein
MASASASTSRASSWSQVARSDAFAWTFVPSTAITSA